MGSSEMGAAGAPDGPEEPAGARRPGNPPPRGEGSGAWDWVVAPVRHYARQRATVTAK